MNKKSNLSRNSVENSALNDQLKSSQDSFLDRLNNHLKEKYPRMEGSGFKLTNDNELEPNFLLQTPYVWGDNANNVPVNQGRFVVASIQKLISSAEQFIDITTLAPFPDGAFFQAIQQGLKSISNNGKDITIRILAGWPPTSHEGMNQLQYLEKLIEPLKEAKNLSIYVAAQRDAIEYVTWNHVKIIAVDGKEAIIGGENLWDANYLGPYPVHDLNIQLVGSAVYYMHKFIDPIWKGVSAYSEDAWKSLYWSSETGIVKQCLSISNLPLLPGKGTVKMLGVGRYGTFDSNCKPADEAILYCIENAEKTILIAQQDLLNTGIPWPAGIKAIAMAIVKGVNVKIVISNDEGKASATLDPNSLESDSYSTSTQNHTYDELVLSIGEMVVESGGQQIKGKFELAVLRFGPSEVWPNGWQFANHAKFFMIDEQVVCIGSENIYPANLIEYIVLFEEQKYVNDVLDNYWNKLWEYSVATVQIYP